MIEYFFKSSEVSADVLKIKTVYMFESSQKI